jgi:hypothetical protein
VTAVAASAGILSAVYPAQAADKRPNIVMLMTDDFIKMHNPTNAAPAFGGRSHLGDYSDSLMKMDADIGKIMDTIRAEAPDTILQHPDNPVPLLKEQIEKVHIGGSGG